MQFLRYRINKKNKGGTKFPMAGMSASVARKSATNNSGDFLNELFEIVFLLFFQDKCIDLFFKNRKEIVDFNKSYSELFCITVHKERIVVCF